MSTVWGEKQEKHLPWGCWWQTDAGNPLWSRKLVLVCETTAALLPSAVSRVFKNEVRKLNWKYIIENWKAHAHAVE